MRQIPDPTTGKYTGDQRITAAEYALISMADSLNQSGKVRKLLEKIKLAKKDQD